MSVLSTNDALKQAGPAAQDIRIEPYEARHILMVRAFNERMRGRGVAEFPESNIPSWLPPDTSRSLGLYQEYFVAADSAAVRGVYILKHQDFFIQGRRVSIAAYQFPVSEGIADPGFVKVGPMLTLDALKKQPRLFVLGMGGHSEKLPQFLKAMRWSFCDVPFFIKILKPFNVLRKINSLRKNFFRKLILDMAAFSGAGWLGIHALQAFKTHRASVKGLRFQEFQTFDGAADILWERVSNEYSMIALRDSQNLNVLYPESSAKFRKINIFEGDRNIGWAVLLDTPMDGHVHFGSLRVGSIIDCLSHPEDAGKILSAATDYLTGRGVDMIVSNHSHHSYVRAFEKLGYLRGPNIFLFTSSRELTRVIGPFDNLKDRFFFMRGDGDGPINL